MQLLLHSSLARLSILLSDLLSLKWKRKLHVWSSECFMSCLVCLLDRLCRNLLKSAFCDFSFYRSNWETEAGVYSESRCRGTPNHFISPRSPQKQHFGVSYCWCRCWIWESNVCLLGNWLWGNACHLNFNSLLTSFVIDVYWENSFLV